ncbi:MAG: GTPase HflX [Defluviitaleaceae bacterium]|nr:GTPase HflX [Defluviitaleaceae bacterium]
MHSTKEQKEKVILVGVATKADYNLIELAELAKTADLEVIGELTQNLDAPHRATYLGKGKIEELKELVEELGADAVITDDELTSSQLSNFSSNLDAKVIDRTMLILDIFAKNAKSSEALAQVEIAGLRYNLSHLAGLGVSLSRIGGGSSGGGAYTRGAGEKKIELDRRKIRAKIDKLNADLQNIKSHRDTTRKQRERTGQKTVALIGYTNAGKSTLMNALTDARVVAQNKLFATLDTTTRKLHIKGKNILISDTVGFIEKLPPAIVKAFRSTLEELIYADCLLHVVDSSNEAHFNQMKIVYETLEELNATHIPVITVFNKIDLVNEKSSLKDKKAVHTVLLSAKKETNIEELINKITHILNL